MVCSLSINLSCEIFSGTMGSRKSDWSQMHLGPVSWHRGQCQLWHSKTQREPPGKLKDFYNKEAHFETFLNVNKIVRDAFHKFSCLRKLFELVPPFLQYGHKNAIRQYKDQL